MGNTVKVDISIDEWTEIVTGGSGYITNESDNVILYREGDTLPLNSVVNGHTLQRKNKVRYQVITGFSVYARSLFPMLSINKLSFVLVTPD